MASSSSCRICSSDPKGHVLRKVADKNQRTVFYTHPSKVKQEYTADEIITHYTHTLADNGPKRWVWVFDGSGFDTDHIMELKTGQGIATLLETLHESTLEEVKVINATIHLKVLLKVIAPFMSDSLKAKVKVLDHPHSILEFI